MFIPEKLAFVCDQITQDELYDAYKNEKTLSHKVLMCTQNHDLILDLNGMNAIMKREECAVGIKEETVKDIAILTRVNKTVSFVIDKIEDNKIYLSRRKAQLKYINYITDNYKVGDIIKAVVTHIEPFGVFVDIGCGVTSLIAIDDISVSRISHPSDRFTVGDEIYTIVKSIQTDPFKISLSHKELLGTWEENANNFLPGQTVCGYVRSVESYGVFIELTPNLAGLAELNSNVKPCDMVSVYIKSINYEKMKIKLVIIDTCPAPYPIPKIKYYHTEGHLDSFIYSTKESQKLIKSDWLEQQ